MDSIQILLKRLSSPRDIVNQLDLVVDMLHDDAERVLARKGFYSESLDDAYWSAARILKKTLLKKHLTGVFRFYSCPPERALRWILARLCNSVKNVLTNEKDSNFIPQKIEITENICSKSNDFLKNEISIDLDRFEKAEIERGLKIVWQEALIDLDFDWLDFVDLCERHGFNAEEISNSRSKAEVDFNGNFQLFFDFEVIT